MVNPRPIFLPALLASVICGCSPTDLPQTKNAASGTFVVMVCLARNWVIWPHCRYQHLKYLLVWQVRGDGKKQRGLWLDTGGRHSRGQNEATPPWKQWLQLTYWHSRRQPVWRHPQIQGQILPGIGLMKNKKGQSATVFFELYSKKGSGFGSHILYSVIVQYLHGLIWRSIKNWLQTATVRFFGERNTTEEMS